MNWLLPSPAQAQQRLNFHRIFIDLYGLQDELTPDIATDDITILGQEAKPDASGKLHFDRCELMAQFVSTRSNGLLARERSKG